MSDAELLELVRRARAAETAARKAGRWSPGFAMTQGLKDSPLEVLLARQVWGMLELPMERVFRQPADEVLVDVWGDGGYATFADQWERIRGGRPLLAEALGAVDDAGVPEDAFGWPLVGKREAPFRRFLAFAREVAGLAGREVFFLPIHAVAGAFGTKPEVARRWVSRAVSIGALELVERHTNRRAARYRWLWPRADSLSQLRVTEDSETQRQRDSETTRQ